MLPSLTWVLLLGSVPDLILCNSINSQPIDITLNEKYENVPMAQDTAQRSPSDSNIFVHQGANFFFNPQLFMYDGFPERIETVLAAIKNCNTTAEKPTATPTHCETTDCNKPEATTTELPIAAFEPEPIFIEELELPPPPQPITIDNDDVYVNILEPVVIPDAPTLPPLSDFKLPEISQDKEIEKPAEVITNVLEDETIEVLSSMPPAPQLPPLELPEFLPPTFTEQVIKPNPCREEIITINENIAPIVIPKPHNLLGVLASIPVVSQVPVIIPVKENCEPYLEIETPVVESTPAHDVPLILPNIGKSRKTVVLLPTASELYATPTLSIDFLIGEKYKERSQQVYPTACAHNIVTERIVPNIMFSENSPKGLKIISVPAALK